MHGSRLRSDASATVSIQWVLFFHGVLCLGWRVSCSSWLVWVTYVLFVSARVMESEILAHIRDVVLTSSSRVRCTLYELVDVVLRQAMPHVFSGLPLVDSCRPYSLPRANTRCYSTVVFEGDGWFTLSGTTDGASQNIVVGGDEEEEKHTFSVEGINPAPHIHEQMATSNYV